MKKHVYIFFCIVLIISAPLRCYASAASGTITVASGSGAGVGGVWAGNGTWTEKIAIGSTLALLHSLGATVKLTQEAITAGKTAYDFMRDKFAQWVGGTSAEDMTDTEREELKKRFKVITGGGGSAEDPDQQQNDGLNVGPDGKIYFSPGTITMLKKFIDWLESTGQINNVPTSSGIYNTFYGDILYINNNPNIYIDPDKECYFGQFRTSASSSEYLYFVFNNVGFRLSAKKGGSTVTPGRMSSVTSNDGTKFTYSISDWGIVRISSNEPMPGLVDISQYGFYGTQGVVNYLKQLTPSEPEVPDGLYKGDNYNHDILDNPDNKTIAVDPQLIPNTTTGQDQQISIPDYIQWIVDNANANAAQSNDPLQVPVTDPVTLAPGNLDVPVNVQDPIDTPLPYEVVDPEDTPVNPVQDPTKLPEPNDTIKLLKVDLKGIFPFCIPWDIYNLLSKFAGDPVTPSIDWDWGNILGFLGINTVTHMDLHDYDGVAEILRNMETVVFVVGLAYATKKVFVK